MQKSSKKLGVVKKAFTGIIDSALNLISSYSQKKGKSEKEKRERMNRFMISNEVDETYEEEKKKKKI